MQSTSSEREQPAPMPGEDAGSLQEPEGAISQPEAGEESLPAPGLAAPPAPEPETQTGGTVPSPS